MMIRENEIYYDKRTHDAYIVTIVGRNLAFFKRISASHIIEANENCVISIDTNVSASDLIINIHRLEKHVDNLIMLGFKEEGNDGALFFKQGVIEKIKELRRKELHINTNMFSCDAHIQRCLQPSDI